MKVRRPEQVDLQAARARDAQELSRVRMVIVALIMVLIAGAAAFPLSQVGKEERYEREYGEMRDLYEAWHSAISAGEWQRAYDMMTPRYRFYKDLEEFQTEFEPYAGPRYTVREEHDIGRFGDEGGIIPNVTVPPAEMLHLLMRLHQGEWQVKGRKQAEREMLQALLKQGQEFDPETEQVEPAPQGESPESN